MAEAKKAAIVKEVILRRLLILTAGARWWHLSKTVGGAMVGTLLAPRRSLDGSKWRPHLQIPPQGLTLPPLYCSLVFTLVFTALWSLFLRVVAAPWKEVGGKLAAGSITLRCKAAKQWLVVNTTPTLCSKRTSARARKVRKKSGNFHGKIKSDS